MEKICDRDLISKCNKHNTLILQAMQQLADYGIHYYRVHQVRLTRYCAVRQADDNISQLFLQNLWIIFGLTKSRSQ